jgi:hypothetical protein
MRTVRQTRCAFLIRTIRRRASARPGILTMAVAVAVAAVVAVAAAVVAAAVG